MTRYGIDLLFNSKQIAWDGCTMEMHKPGYWTRERMQQVGGMIGEPDVAQDVLDGEESFLQQILDSKYEKQDLLAVSKAQGHLSLDQRWLLEETLMKHDACFDGMLRKWPDLKVEVKLKPHSKPYHCQKPFQIPHVYLEMFKKEVD